MDILNLRTSRLKRYNHPHSPNYKRGLKSEDMQTIVDFLYSGEANFSQENLDSFLAQGEEIQLKGLTTVADNTRKEVKIESDFKKAPVKTKN